MKNKNFYKSVLISLLFLITLNFALAEANYSDANAYTNFTWNDTYSNNNFTISSWIYLKSSGTMPVYYKPCSYEFLINSNNQTQFKLNNATTFSNSQSINLSQWTFVAISYNGTSLNFWINQNKTSQAYSSGYYKPSNTFEAIIGKDYFDNFNGTIDEIIVYDKALTDNEINLLYNSNLKKTSATLWLLKIIQNGLQVGSSYLYSFFVSDFSGRTASTLTRTINGNTVPSFASITYTPNSTDSLDPSTQISITTNISDLDSNFASAKVQWKNSTAGDWSNITLENQTVKSTYTILNTTLTLPAYEDNITFRIWANDSAGGFATSDNYTLSSYYDCTWSVSPSTLEETVGFYEDKFLGNLTLINTGDAQYSNNNCSISFTIGYSGFTSSYTGLLSDSDNWATDNRVFQYTSPITVNASTNQTLSINFSFPSTTSSFTESPTLVVTSSINDTISNNKTSYISSTLIVSPPNPLLYQEISQYPTTYVLLTPQNISLSSYVRNLGYDATNSFNTTAHNVSFSWTLPSDLSSRILEGNETNFYNTLANSSKQYNNLTIALTSSNLASMSKGSLDIAIFSYGYKNDSDSFSLIENSGDLTLLNETVSVQFLCYDVSDSICVSACGIGVDPDCVASSSSTGSGGGGGGSAKTAVSVATSADFQLVRGDQNEVKITFENENLNESLTDLTFLVSGKISKYLDLSPKSLSYLGPGQNITLTLKITSPSYLELGKQDLVITLNGKRGQNAYTDSKKVTLEVHELSGSTAKDLLAESDELIDRLNKANLSSEYLKKLLEESHSSMTLFDYETVRDNHKIISEQVNAALNTLDVINNLENLIVLAKDKGISIGDSERLLKLAKLSLSRLEFSQAYNRALDAQSTYAFEVKGELGSIEYYLKEYPDRISFGALFLILFSFGSYRLGKLSLIKKKIKALKLEEKLINELIGVVQSECFKEKKMSMQEYNDAMNEYQRRLAIIIGQLISLENQRVHALKFTGMNKKLQEERKNILKLITELQKDYLKRKKMETRTYEFKLESYNQRLGEIDEKIATFEAKKFYKKNLSGGKNADK